ncbi:MAG TPA: hypothetical protein VHM19_05020, partial [Polyangiales bacterium]|nr:hypothetical protein [Polyangiales bacterium]
MTLAACGSDSKKADCPDGAVCTAGTGGDATGGGSGSGAGAGGSSGMTGSGNAGSGGSGSGSNAGSGGSTGSAGSGGSGTQAEGKPANDGTKLAACDPRDMMSCGMDLSCYTAGGATQVGFCTTACTMDSDCTALGSAFTCSTTAQQGMMNYCRQTCTGTDDKSCPMYMSCTQVQGGFRCLYDAKDLGSGTGGEWDKCQISGDCTGDLTCTGGRQSQFGNYFGACTSPCMMDADCKNAPSTGTIKPTCQAAGPGGSGHCTLRCTPTLNGSGGTGGSGSGGTGGSGAAAECPDGMSCAIDGGGGGN